MIRTFKSKALKKYYEKGDASKLNPQHIQKITDILTQLDAAKAIKDMNYVGSDFHKLSGQLKNFYSVSVRANWKIIFRFENGDVYDVDYLDYH